VLDEQADLGDAVAGNGGADAVNVSPSSETSVITFVPSYRTRSHRSFVGGASFPVFGNCPP
jgi:hypothetical protein